MEEFYISPGLYASKGKRFLNFIIDYAFRFLMAVGIFLIIDVLATVNGNTSIENMGSMEEIVLNVLVLLIYYTFLESVFGISIGKLITGTKVVDLHGQKPGFGTILARSFCRMIPFNALAGLLGDQFWHDSLTRTAVVDKRLLEQERLAHEHMLKS